ncbi:Smr/MutS family protein [Orrella marina]|nr:Smr/MutS family protein [Orrella marina]
MELFRQAMRDVTPLRNAERVTHAARPVPESVQRRRTNASADQHPRDAPLSDFQYDPESPSNAFHRANGVSSDVLRRLRKDVRSIRATLDLHGMTVDQARNELAQFIKQCCLLNYRRIRIIHGQGFGSSAGVSILRLQTRHWLSQMPEVLGYVSPDSANGGEGAVLVLLRPPQKVDHG